MGRLTVFVACPYSIFPLDDYKKAFEEVRRQYNVSFKFADEQITNQSILHKITNYIREHDISLFDITGWNPNVALELGIAVGLSKRYFILFNPSLESNKDVPSDIRGIDRIQYESNSELEAKLILLLKQELPEKVSQDSAFDLVKTAIGEELSKSPGLSAVQLAEKIGQDKALVKSTLKVLVQSNLVRPRGIRRGVKYYPQHFDFRKLGKK